jgi:hypothetical protein
MPNSSYIQYTSTAGQVNYPINTIDGWLSPTFLKVTIDGVLKSVTTDYTLQTIGVTPTIVLNTAPTLGSIVRIARDTPKTVSSFQGGVVDFQDASILTAQDLDNAVVGLLHISQEGADTGNGALGPSADGTAWDADSKKITAVAAPSDPGDAATKNYVDTLALYGKAQTVPQTWEFVATAGQTNFNLSAESPEPLATVPEMYLVTKNGVTVTPTGYTFSGAKGNISLALTAPNAASLNDKVLIRNFGVARAVADAIAPGSITDVYLATDAVTADKIAADAVTTVKINTGAVTETKIGAGAVTNAKLGALAVQTANISNGAVTIDKIGNGAVDTDQLAAAAVTNSKIEDGTIGTAKLSTSVTVSTLSSPGAALDMNTQKITNLGTPTNAADAATKLFVETAVNAVGTLSGTVRNFVIQTIAAGTAVVAPNATTFNTSITTASYTPKSANSTIYVVPLATSGMFLSFASPPGFVLDNGLLVGINERENRAAWMLFHNNGSGTASNLSVTTTVTASAGTAPTIDANNVTADAALANQVRYGAVYGIITQSNSTVAARSFTITTTLTSNTTFNNHTNAVISKPKVVYAIVEVQN